MYDEFDVPDVLIVLFYVHVKTVETKLSGVLIPPGGGGVLPYITYTVQCVYKQTVVLLLHPVF